MTTNTGDPLHSRAACTQPCNVNTHRRAHCSPGARLCEQWGHGCVNNGARLCASARLCRGSPVTKMFSAKLVWLRNYYYSHNEPDGDAHHQPHHCLFNCLFRPRSLLAFCAGNSPVTDEFPAQRPVTMMTSSNENIFRVIGHFCGEFAGPLWISLTKASDEELWCFLWSAPE